MQNNTVKLTGANSGKMIIVPLFNVEGIKENDDGVTKIWFSSGEHHLVKESPEEVWIKINGG